ncbi:DMT family transporter [Pseudonocardia sp. WMMC193]|uniref:DMT family transporter n=1 Tax=Pseudonocardia sp. WMMC193 TaxID=2911965 RepID=UPI001F378F3A|nr:DMT family transporter [Pseudonocardia sp. WMMC193]MCF7549725.1 DMT family transporter [Pseudonocardia sp. WMMC193]
MQIGVAALLAVASAVFYGLSAVLQQREACRFAGVDGASGLALVGRLARRRGWWAAILASLTAAGLHLLALHAGPLVVVQPVGVSAVAFALLIGRRVNGEPISGRSWAGVACVVVGLPLVLAAVPHGPHGAHPEAAIGLWPAAGILALLVAAAVAAAAVFGHSRPRAAAVCHAIGAALSFGLASGTVKVIMVEGAEPARFALVGAAMLMGVVLAQHAYRDGGLGAPLAVVTLVDPLAAGALGVLVMGEPFGADPVALLLGVAGAVVTSVGVALLAARPEHRPTPVPAVPLSVPTTPPSPGR